LINEADFKAILLLIILLTARVNLFSQAKTIQPTTSNKELKMENQNSESKEYILLVRLPLDYGPDKAKEVREQWNVLLDKWKANGTYVTSFVYPADGYLVTGSEKSVTNETVVSNNFKLVSNMILRAKDYEAALLLAKECPVLAQAGMIEVREIQPRPKPNQKTAVNRNLYAIIYSPGENYDFTKSIYQQDLKEHGLYMKQLSDSGKLLLAGAFTKDAGGMVILNVTDEGEAVNIVSKDPAVLKRIFNYKMNIWDIAFKTVKF
jgi:uncharacterized protein YciI